jgi:hypothetical protein
MEELVGRSPLKEVANNSGGILPIHWIQAHFQMMDIGTAQAPHQHNMGSIGAQKWNPS